MTLEALMTQSDQSRWLDIGSGGVSDTRFFKLDTLPLGELLGLSKKDFLRGSICDLSRADVATLGEFDLVRMQHVIEHLSIEDGIRAVTNCGQLLRQGGVLLITAPDLRIHIDRYLGHAQHDEGYLEYARARVPADSPPSFLFSVYAHSLTYEPHRWCYDAAGLMYLLNYTEMFVGVEELVLDDPRASVPFTHNRPAEDVCVLAVRGANRSG